MAEWSSSELLPHGWRFKKFNTPTTNECVFMSHKGDWVRGGLQAIKLMENSELYTQDDFDNINQLLAKNAAENRSENMEENISSLVLPEGWKSSTIGKWEYVLSPEGDKFNGARFALAELVRRGSGEEELENLRSSMVGWRRSEYLPAGWMFQQERKTEFCRLQFLASSGELLRSFVAAIKFMEKSDLYSEEDSKNINKLHDQISKGGRTINFEEKTSTLVLPEGWKARTVGKWEYVLSPEGDQFKGPRFALAEMVRRGYGEEELENLRSSMVGWSRSEYLPAGWMFKHGMKVSRNTNCSRVQFLASTGDLLESYISAIRFMEKNEYSGEDVKNLNKLLTQMTAELRKVKVERSSSDLVLPEGWKARYVGSREYVLSPEGQQFNGARFALAELVRREFSEDELENLRSSMVGWRRSEYLPAGWMFQQERSTDYSRLQFLASSGELLKSFVAVMKFMGNSDQYTEEDIKNLDKLSQKTTKEGRQIKEEEGSTTLVLPEGWKSRTIGSREYVVSPEGDQFNTSRIALVEMVKWGLPEVELENLRNSMAEWSSSDLLPHGWRFKAQKRSGDTHELQLISESGEWVRGKLQAMKIIEEKCPENTTNFENFVDWFRKQSKQEAFEWNEDDKSIPGGWKSRWGKSQECFLSPDGLQLTNRVAILQHLVAENDKNKQVEEMRKSLVKYEGFKESQYLPYNWISKSRWTILKGSTKATQNYITILSEEGQLFDSYLAAKSFMELHDKYDQDDVNKIKLFIDENSKARRVEQIQEVDLTEEETSVTISKQEYLPEGWTMKMEGQREVFLSPDGSLCRTRKFLLKHLLTNNYTVEDVTRVRSSLALDGWMENEMLPTGWMFKVVLPSLKFLTTEGEDLDGIEPAQDFIQSNPQAFSLEDLEAFKAFHEIQSGRLRMMKYEWREDTTVPAGWRSRVGGKRSFFISPEGQQFPSRVAILQHLIREEEEELVEEVRRQVVEHEGWQESRHLPAGWIYSHSRKEAGNSRGFTTVKLLSAEGQLLDSYVTAKAYMKEHGNYNNSHRINIDKLVKLRQKI